MDAIYPSVFHKYCNDCMIICHILSISCQLFVDKTLLWDGRASLGYLQPPEMQINAPAFIIKLLQIAY